MEVLNLVVGGVILPLPPKLCSWVLEENLEFSLHGEVLSSLVRD